jgi:hypothetical protein
MPKHDPKRRILLSRAITLGTALTVFPVLSACRDQETDSPAEPDRARPDQPTSERPGAPEDGAAPSQPRSEVAKITKAQAQYQEQPQDDQQCSNCVHFLADSGSCKLVQGSIAPEAWCMLWAQGS